MNGSCTRGCALFIAALMLLAACSDSNGETACSDALERLGYRVCVHQVPDESTWTSITFPAEAIDQDRATTYMVPEEFMAIANIFICDR